MATIDVSLAEETFGPRRNSEEFSDCLPTEQRAGESAVQILEEMVVDAPVPTRMKLQKDVDADVNLLDEVQRPPVPWYVRLTSEERVDHVGCASSCRAGVPAHIQANQ